MTNPPNLPPTIEEKLADVARNGTDPVAWSLLADDVRAQVHRVSVVDAGAATAHKLARDAHHRHQPALAAVWEAVADWLTADVAEQLLGTIALEGGWGWWGE